MGFLYLFIAIASESAAKTIDKLNFSKTRIASRHLMLLVFVAMSVSLLLFIILTNRPLPELSLIPIILLSLIGLISFGGNVLDFLSLKADDLSLREPLVDFEPILAGLVGYLLFPAERQPGFLLAFGLGALIVYWGTHRRKLRKLQRKGMFYLVLAVLLYALLPSLYKLTLEYVSPEYITFFRVVSILLLTVIFNPVKKLKSLSPPKIVYGFASGIIYAIGAVASLYVIKTFGVVVTALLHLLGPALRYTSGYLILKEKVRRGEVVSSFLLAVVILATIFI